MLTPDTRIAGQEPYPRRLFPPIRLRRSTFVRAAFFFRVWAPARANIDAGHCDRAARSASVGQAVHDAYAGDFDLAYDKEGYFVRVAWNREK